MWSQWICTWIWSRGIWILKVKLLAPVVQKLGSEQTERHNEQIKNRFAEGYKYLRDPFSTVLQMTKTSLLPSMYLIRGKVMFLVLFVCLFTGDHYPMMHSERLPEIKVSLDGSPAPGGRIRQEGCPLLFLPGERVSLEAGPCFQGKEQAGRKPSPTNPPFWPQNISPPPPRPGWIGLEDRGQYALEC